MAGSGIGVFVVSEMHLQLYGVIEADESAVRIVQLLSVPLLSPGDEEELVVVSLIAWDALSTEVSACSTSTSAIASASSSPSSVSLSDHAPVNRITHASAAVLFSNGDLLVLDVLRVCLPSPLSPISCLLSLSLSPPVWCVCVFVCLCFLFMGVCLFVV
jgi:hypothetical protein